MSAGDDPYCREAFPWDEPGSWDKELLAFYQQATALRHRYPVLRTGTFESLYASGDIYAFSRKLNPQEAIVFFNADTSSTPLTLELAEVASARFVQAWPVNTNNSYQVTEGQLEITLPAREAVVLISET